MGCGSTNDVSSLEDTKKVIEPPPPQFKTINIIFKLSTGEEYEITGNENDVFKTVLDKFISEHQEINNKTINALYENTQITMSKTLLENKIKENNLILLNIEDPKPEPEIEPEEMEVNISIEYNPENVIWIDPNVDNSENTGYLEDLNALGYNVKCFKNVDDAMDIIKSIKFESTKIIISGRLYIQFIKKFLDEMNNLYVIPKIIIFTRQKDLFIESNKENEDIINHPFFNFGGIRIVIDDIIKFLKDEIVQNRVKKAKKETENINTNEIMDTRLKIKDNAKLTFEYIDNSQKLTLPLFYKALIDSANIDEIDKYTELLYSKYAESSLSLKELLNPIKSMYDIPLELLSKYYARAYTIESDFYREINRDLRENKTAGYLPYIKVLYEGIKLKSLEIAFDNELYRGSKINLDEISQIKDYLNNKITNLPGAIVFSKSFLSFSKERSIAEGFMGSGYLDNNLGHVLYILEKDKNLDHTLSTQTDIEKISYFNSEKEVLFLPFSPFEIKEIKEIEENRRYEIRLLYLGRYLKQIEKDINITDIENEIPDSEFKNQILELGLITKNKVKNTKQIFNNFKQFQNNVKNNKYKKFVVKEKTNLFKSVNEELSKSMNNILRTSFNKKSTYLGNKSKLYLSQNPLQKSKILSFNDRFTIKTIEDGEYIIKVVTMNIPSFISEYLIPIWFEKGKYLKFKTEGKYRINNNFEYHDSSGISSSMKFNYGAIVARIGSGEPFVLPSKEFIYFSEVEGPLYIKINFPKNVIIKPEGKLIIKIYDGKLMAKNEIYAKIGWKEKELKYKHANSKVIENELTIFLNNLRMNPILFYESYVKDDNLKKTWTGEFLENMGKNNDTNGIKHFSVNNNLYEIIQDYIESKYDQKKLTKKNSIENMKDLQKFLDLYLKEKINQDIIINCKIIKKSEMKHICLQYLYDKDFIPNIFNNEYNSIAVNVKDDIFDDFYLIILAITKEENNDNKE